MLRILHIADVHLDTPFNCRAEKVRSRLRAALNGSFTAAVDCAIAERVHAVLIAGDLAEAEYASFTAARLVHAEVGRLAEAGIAVYYAAGNHDPGTAWLDSWGLDWAPNLNRIGGAAPAEFGLVGDSGQVEAMLVAAGHRSADEQTNLVATFPDAHGSLPFIGLVHAHVARASSSGSHGRYARCTADDLATRQYAYWALGHVHVRQQIAGTNAWYSGNTLGRNPRETGAKGGHIVTLDSGPPVVEFRSFASIAWEELVIEDVGDICSDQDLVLSIVDRLGEPPGVGDRIVKVTLAGACPLTSDLKVDQRRLDIEEAVVEESGALDVEIRTGRLTTPIDVSALREGRHALAESIALVDDIRENGPDAIEHLAPTRLATRHSNQDSQRKYLTELVDDLEYELAERFMSR